MKYGRAFEQIAADNPSFAKWDASVTKYKALKKVINSVAQELNSAGLEAHVLKQLLATDGLESSDKTLLAGIEHARAEYELQGSAESPVPRIRITLTPSADPQHQHDLTSQTDAQLVARLQRLLQHDAKQAQPRSQEMQQGDSSTPFQSLPPQMIRQISGSGEDSEGKEEEEEADRSGETVLDTSVEHLTDQVTAPPPTSPLLARLYGYHLLPASAITPPGSPRLHQAPPVATAADTPSLAEPSSPSWMNRRVSDLPPDLTLPDASLPVFISNERDPPPSAGPSSQPLESTPASDGPAQRVVYVPLPKDTHFFNMLSQTVASLQALEQAQRDQFQEQIQTLANSVRKVAAPKSRTDLYRWRDIFSLWIEAAIFQGQTELDRGERSSQDARARLVWFTDQVGRRKLASKMRFKASKKALETFIELNQSLLELKEFVEANHEAVRKILKKHDKRTALHASSSFSALVASDSDTGSRTTVTSSSSIFVLPGLVSLPQVILASFTNTLLPVVPQIDDVVCMICSDVAYRPIRLPRCGHKLCLSCLSQMQKMKQNACPVCRTPGILEASTTDIDQVLQAYVQRYFPKEASMIANEQDQEATQAVLDNIAHPGGNAKCIVS